MATLLLPLLAALARPILASPACPSNNGTYIHPANGVCTDVTIEEEVTYAKVNWVYPKPQNNFDLVALSSEGTLAGSAGFHPISGAENVTNTYKLSGTFCTPVEKNGGKENTVLLASHGGGYDRRYWASSYMPSEYSFVQYALANGYSVFYYDRLGTGKSQIVSGYEAQPSNEIELIAKIAQGLRNGKYTGGAEATKVALVGHSLGSIFSLGAITKYPDIAEGAVLTGAALPNRTDPSLLFRGISAIFQRANLASTLNPPFDRDSGYVGFADIYGHAEAFFHQPFDIPTIEYAQSIAQPASVVEMLASGMVKTDRLAYTGSVLVTSGEFDVLACGGYCPPRFAYGTQNETFANARVLETYVHPGAGHGVNFARNATGFYGKIVEFLDRTV